MVRCPEPVLCTLTVRASLTPMLIRIKPKSGRPVPAGSGDRRVRGRLQAMPRQLLSRPIVPRARLLTRDDRSEAKPDLTPLGTNTLGVRRAESTADMVAAQRLRYRVFYEEMGAKPVGRMAKLRRDYDRFDPYCEHLLVVDREAPKEREVVGTYRMLRLERATRFRRGLYTETEYDLSGLRASGCSVMEVSRSCVLPEYRKRTTINLLWAAIATYVFHYNIDYLIGVASFEGTNVNAYADQFAYLNQYHRAGDAIRPVAHRDHYTPFPAHTVPEEKVREVLRTLPPLLRGYLSLGAVVGDGLYIDHQFNTIDACIMVDMRIADRRFLDHYRRSGQRKG